MTRLTVDEMAFIDVNELNQLGAFAGPPMKFPFMGLRTWNRVMEYKGLQWSKDRPPQRVPILWTRCKFGGGRPWFQCPCGRRVAKLYWGLSTIYRCRHCKEAIYASQRKGP